MKKIARIHFAENVRKPHNMHGTGQLTVATPESTLADRIDAAEETPSGVICTVDFNGVRHRAFYPWGVIATVKYEPEEIVHSVIERPEPKTETKSKKGQPFGAKIVFEDEPAQ